MINTIGNYWSGGYHTNIGRSQYSDGNTFSKSLKAYYKFDGNLLDSSSSGFNLESDLAPVYYNDGNIKALKNVDYARLIVGSYPDLYTSLTSYSIAMWVKTPNIIKPEIGTDFYYGLSNNMKITLACTEHGYSVEYNLVNYSTMDDGINQVNELLLDKWNSIVLTWDRTFLRKYINGKLINCNQVLNYGQVNFFGSEIIDFNLPVSYGDVFLFDDFYYWEKCITPSEVSFIYSNRNLGV